MQAVSLKTSYLVAFQICLFQSFDIHLLFIAQLWYFYNTFSFLTRSLSFRNQILSVACGIWLLLRHPCACWHSGRWQQTKITTLGREEDFRFGLSSSHWQASLKTLRVDRRISWKEEQLELIKGWTALLFHTSDSGIFPWRPGGIYPILWWQLQNQPSCTSTC